MLAIPLDVTSLSSTHTTCACEKVPKTVRMSLCLDALSVATAGDQVDPASGLGLSGGCERPLSEPMCPCRRPW